MMSGSYLSLAVKKQRSGKGGGRSRTHPWHSAHKLQHPFPDGAGQGGNLSAALSAGAEHCPLCWMREVTAGA